MKFNIRRAEEIQTVEIVPTGSRYQGTILTQYGKYNIVADHQQDIIVGNFFSFRIEIPTNNYRFSSLKRGKIEKILE